MYIHPDSNINILKNCPLDPTYDHTLWFDDATKQRDYFASIAKFKLTEQSYQRVQRGVMRVKIKAEDLYDCNYLMFQNSAFGTKWFYAFIQSVEYVNNITSEIVFIIDVMQTWFFDYQLERCFVDREHAVTDTVGANTVPETLEQGPYVINDYGTIAPPNANKTSIMMLTTFNQSIPGFPEYTGERINGIYTGLFVGFYENAFLLNQKIEEIAAAEGGKVDGIVGIYMCPFDELSLRDDYKPYVSIPKYYKGLNGYVPKNAKLLTYPYNVLHIYTADGSANFRYEMFNTSDCTFQWREAVIPEPSLALAPINYAGWIAADGDGAIDGDPERVMVSTYYPQCSWNNDVYRQYLSEHNESISLAKMSTAINGALNVTSDAIGVAQAITNKDKFGAVQAGIRGIQDAANTYLDIKQQVVRLSELEKRPPEVNGVQSSGADFAFGYKEFRFKYLTIRAEYARIIDDYFNAYGYATHRIKVPNRNSRPHWNYVKTIGCVIRGSIPADDVTSICAIYNNGITFWKNPDEVGDYSLDNRPSGVG